MCNHKYHFNTRGMNIIVFSQFSAPPPPKKKSRLNRVALTGDCISELKTQHFTSGATCGSPRLHCTLISIGCTWSSFSRQGHKIPCQRLKLFHPLPYCSLIHCAEPIYTYSRPHNFPNLPQWRHLVSGNTDSSIAHQSFRNTQKRYLHRAISSAWQCLCTPLGGAT